MVAPIRDLSDSGVTIDSRIKWPAAGEGLKVALSDPEIRNMFEQFDATAGARKTLEQIDASTSAARVLQQFAAAMDTRKIFAQFDATAGARKALEQFAASTSAAAALQDFATSVDTSKILGQIAGSSSDAEAFHQFAASLDTSTILRELDLEEALDGIEIDQLFEPLDVDDTEDEHQATAADATESTVPTPPQTRQLSAPQVAAVWALAFFIVWMWYAANQLADLDSTGELLQNMDKSELLKFTYSTVDLPAFLFGLPGSVHTYMTKRKSG